MAMLNNQRVVVPESPFILFRVGPVDCMSRDNKRQPAPFLQKNSASHMDLFCSKSRLHRHGLVSHSPRMEASPPVEASNLRRNLKDWTPTKHLSLTDTEQTAPISRNRSWFWFTWCNQSKTLHTKMQWLYSGCTPDMCSAAGHWQAKSSAPVQRRYLWAGTTLPPPKQLGRSHLESEASEPLWIHANLPQR